MRHDFAHFCRNPAECRTLAAHPGVCRSALGTLHLTYRWAKRIAIAIVGGTVVLIGVAMIVLPGPAVIVIPMGLGILALEFAWAKRWLDAIKERGTSFAKIIFRGRPR